MIRDRDRGRDLVLMETGRREGGGRVWRKEAGVCSGGFGAK